MRLGYGSPITVASINYPVDLGRRGQRIACRICAEFVQGFVQGFVLARSCKGDRKANLHLVS